MAVNRNEDNADIQEKVKLPDGDIGLNFKSDELNKFELDPKKAPHNKSVGGKPHDTSKDEYNESKYVGSDGEEAVKASREKFAKKKDDPAGISAANPKTKEIKKALDETDPQRKSQVMPQLHSQFGMISGILNSSSSGGQGQSQQQITAGQPDYDQTLDGNTKELLISAVTNGWAILTRNYGFQKVLDNIQNATTGYYTEKEMKAAGFANTVTLQPYTYRFDMLPPDYQDVVSASIVLITKMVEKYGQGKVPFIEPFFKPKTHRTPRPLLEDTYPSKYSILEYYTPEELPEITINGSTDILNNFISLPVSVSNPVVNGDIVLYKNDTGNNVITGLKSNTYYNIIQSNSSGFSLAKLNSGNTGAVISISNTSEANGTFYGLEEFSGYAKWYKLDGTLEYTTRNNFFPDFETVDLHVVYLSAYSFSYDLFNVIPQEAKENQLNINLLAKLLDRYKRKIENDYMDLTTGWGISADNGEPNTSFPQQDQGGGGGGGNQAGMLGQLLPQLQQAMQKSKTEHLPKSVLEQGKMNKLLKNLEKKKMENKRMANLADSAVGAGGLNGLLGGLGDLGGMGGLGGLSGGLGGFGGLSGLGQLGGLGGLGSMFGGGDITGLLGNVTGMFGKGGGGGGGGSTQTGLGGVTTESITPVTVRNVNVNQEVINVYRLVLKREPDKPGLLYWISIFESDMIKNGYNVAYKNLVQNFKSSVEYKSRVLYEEYKDIPGIENLFTQGETGTTPVINVTEKVSDVYRLYLRREPDQAGLNYWSKVFETNIIKSGYDIAYANLIKSFQSSKEYLALNKK
jgi:hypothetical protein